VPVPVTAGGASACLAKDLAPAESREQEAGAHGERKQLLADHHQSRESLVGGG